MVRIAPSILSADFGVLAEEIARVEAAGADQIHIDVMDGRFVPNISMGFPILDAIRKRTRLPLDLVLVMSVNPGFGGQKFIPAVYPKIRQIRTMLGARGVDVSIDGGVKLEHARPLAEHGASVLVAGSAVFEAQDPAKAIRELRAAAELGQQPLTLICQETAQPGAPPSSKSLNSFVTGSG